MSTEDKPTPNKENMFDVAIPGTQRVVEEDEEEEAEEDGVKEEVEKEPEIDFSENLEMGTDEFLEFLKEKQAKEAEEKKEK